MKFENFFSLFKENEKIIFFSKEDKIVFVGDTHGDLETSKKVLDEFLKKDFKILFLGDYVDRGPFSKENINFLLEKKSLFPEKIFLLAGNHEHYFVEKFSPADFWENLSKKEFSFYQKIFSFLPLVAIGDNFVALHGALPDVKKIGDFKKIKLGDKNWQAIVWGDFEEKEGDFLGYDPFSGRPIFGKERFYKVMRNLKKKILVRSHDPSAKEKMFNGRCFTIFSSRYYQREVKILIKKGNRFKIQRI